MRQGINHLVLRHGIYYFRIAIPKRLQGRFRKEELKYSLRTADKLHARQLCRSMSSNAETLFEFITSMPDLTEAQVQEISRNYFRALLEDGNELVWCLGNDPITSQPRDPNLDRNSEAIIRFQRNIAFFSLSRKAEVHIYVESPVTSLAQLHEHDFSFHDSCSNTYLRLFPLEGLQSRPDRHFLFTQRVIGLRFSCLT